MGNFQWQVLSVVESYKKWVMGLKISNWIDGEILLETGIEILYNLPINWK